MTCYAVTGLTNDPDPQRIDSIHPTEAEAEAEAARLIRDRIVTRHVVIYQLPDQETPVSEPGCYICQPDNQNAAEEGCAACEKAVLEAVMRAYSSRSSSLAPTTIPVRGAEQHTTQEADK